MTIAFQTAKAHGRIGGVRLTVRRGARSAPSTFPAGRPTAGELAAFGLRALDTVGARLALIFLATSLAGILLATSPGSPVLGRMVLGGIAVAGCAVEQARGHPVS